MQKKQSKRKSPKKRKCAEVDITEPGPSPSKVAKEIGLDHSYANLESNLPGQVKKLKQKVKVLQVQLSRRNRKIRNMKELLDVLKTEKLILDEQHSLLQHNFTGVTESIFRDQVRNLKLSKPHGNRYSDEVKQFAMTLHYYSPKAYDFVRKVLSLPHPSSIRTWAASVDCDPGYLTNVINCLGSQVLEKPWMSDVVLIVDAMALHKGTMWDQKSRKYVGTVDYGAAIPEVPDSLATEALVFMISGMTGHFKHPIGYVLQDKCSSAVQAQLIKDCIGLLYEQGLNVTAVVFDGCYTNQGTARLLGCKMKVSEMKTWFSHPQAPSSKIHVVYDVCHLMKLIRNLLGDYKVIYHEGANGGNETNQMGVY